MDDTASIMKEPNSALSGTLQEPHTHEDPLRCPGQVSSVPEQLRMKLIRVSARKKMNKSNKFNFLNNLG